METEALRVLTADACHRLKGKLWPNGLGFDRSGWEYRYLERQGRWEAFRRLRYAHMSGEGSTPEEAKANATRKVA